MNECVTCATALPDGATLCFACGTSVAPPAAARPGNVRPGIARPGVARPGVARPGFVRAPVEAPRAPYAPVAPSEVPVVVQQPAPPLPPATPGPPSAPPGPPPVPRPPGPPLLPELMGGDWAGAALATGVGIVAVTVLALVLTGVAAIGAGFPDVGTFLQVVVAAVTLGIGGGVHGAFDIGDSGGGSEHVRLFLLTLGLVGYGAMGRVTLGRLRRLPPTPRALGLQVARVAVLWLGVCVVVVVLGQLGHLSTGSTGSDDYDADFSDSSALESSGVGLRPDIVSTLVRGSLVAALAGGAAVLVVLRQVVEARLGAWGASVRVQLAGVVTLVGVVTVLAVPLLLTLVLVEGSDESSFPLLGAGTAALPNIGVFGLLTGLGAPVGLGSGITVGSASISDLVDANPAWLLLVVGALLAAVLTSAAVVLRAGADVRRQGLLQGAVLALVLPVLSAVSAPHAGASVAGGGGLAVGGSTSVHNSFGWAFVIGLVWGAFTAFVAPHLVGGLPGGALRALRRVLLVREPARVV